MQVKRIFYLFFSLFSLLHIVIGLFLLSQDDIFFAYIKGLEQSIGAINWFLLAQIFLIGGLVLILINTILYRLKANNKDKYIPRMLLMIALILLAESFIYNLIQ